MNGNMNKSGGVDMVNLLKVRMEIRILENRLALLKDQLVTEETGFNRYLNRPSGSMVFTVDSLRAEKVPADINQLADSLAGNPVVRMYKAQSEAGTAMLSKAKKLGLPKVGVGIDYMLIQQRAGNSSMMNGKNMAMPMISLTLPIYRKKYRSMQHEAELTRDAAALSAESIMNDLEVSYRQTMQALNDAGRRIKLYEGQILLAERSIQLLITSFSTGETDLDEVLRMEQQLLAYRLDHAGAVADLNTALAKLLFLTGDK